MVGQITTIPRKNPPPYKEPPPCLGYIWKQGGVSFKIGRRPEIFQDFGSPIPSESMILQRKTDLQSINLSKFSPAAGHAAPTRVLTRYMYMHKRCVNVFAKENHSANGRSTVYPHSEPRMCGSWSGLGMANAPSYRCKNVVNCSREVYILIHKQHCKCQKHLATDLLPV